ncbi:MAG: glycosyltransferase family 2 protein [Candidatus Electryoneaceae bacterium]|nr:glycosyltransferase family 2 protein [Candidatus Electryoneaceae bacterium]
MKGTVVIVMYNAIKFVGECLNSLKTDAMDGWINVVAVDNVSTDGTAEYVAEQYPWVTLVRSPDNGGFGAGNNIGLSQMDSDDSGQSDWCFILNPDTVVSAGCLRKLSDFLDEHQDVGCVGPGVTDESGEQIVSYQPFMNLWTSFWVAVGLQRILPLNRTDEQWELRRHPPSKIVQVDRLLGAAMMIRRLALDQIGGFDERYFLYSEEEDLCIRLQNTGWKIAYNPSGTITHSGAKSTGADNPLAIAATDWSRYLFMAKHYSKGTAEISRWIWIVMITLRYLLSFLKGGARKEGYRLSLKSLINIGYFDRELRPKRADH